MQILISIDAYYRDSLNVLRQISSGMLGAKTRETLAGTGYVFFLSGVANQPRTVYVRMRATNTLLVPVKLVNEQQLNIYLPKTYSLQLVFAGIGLMLLIFQLFMYTVTRNKLFLLYLGRILLLYYFGMVFYLQGYGLLLGPQPARFFLSYAHFFISVGYICSIYFNNRFLRLKKYWTLGEKVFYGLVVLWAIQSVISLFGRVSLTNEITQWLSFVTSVLILYSSIHVILVKGKKGTGWFKRFYVLGWCPVALVSIYLMFCLQDILPFKSYSFTLLSLAGMIEGIFISLGLFGRRLSSVKLPYGQIPANDTAFIKLGDKEFKSDIGSDPSKVLSLTELAVMARSGDPAFLNSFLENHPIFIAILRAKAPSLLPNELELCALLYINFTTKDIALAHRMSVRAVESRKFRVRKKLRLEGSVNLQLWLMDIAKSS